MTDWDILWMVIATLGAAMSVTGALVSIHRVLNKQEEEMAKKTEVHLKSVSGEQFVVTWPGHLDDHQVRLHIDAEYGHEHENMAVEKVVFKDE